MQFEIEEFDFIDLHLIRIRDENGKLWYPLNNFLSKILFRTINMARYRDDPRFSPYMKVFEYVNPKSITHYPTKTWFIDEEGMREILSTIRIAEEDPKKLSTKKRYLMEAYAMFNVKDGKVQQTEYITYTPPLTHYDVWSKICLMHDKDLIGRIIWKKCEKCGFFYPDTQKYYACTGGTLRSPNCKQCEGLDFICQNTRIQYIHKKGGQEFLYQWFKGNKERAFNEIDKWLREGDIY